MIDAQNAKAETALHVACKMLCNSAIETLLHHGASTDMCDDKGRTPLHIVACARPSHERDNAAAAQARLTCVQTLLKAKASPNATDSNGSTPLHSCCEVGDVACVVALLQSGACTTIANNAEDTPLHLAAAAGHVDCMQRLVLWDRRRAKNEGWIQYETEDGTPYWHHPSSGESRWEPPSPPLPLDYPDHAPEVAAGGVSPPRFDIQAESEDSSHHSLEVSSSSEEEEENNYSNIPPNEEESWTSINTDDIVFPPPPPDSGNTSRIRTAAALAALGHGVDDNVELPKPPSQARVSVDTVTPNGSDDQSGDAFPANAVSPVVETVQPTQEEYSEEDVETGQSNERHLAIWDTFFTNAARAAHERSNPTSSSHQQDDDRLLAAARDGDADSVKELLNKGCSPGVCDDNGMTALHHAQSLEIVQILVDFDADVNASDADGNAPLHVAVARGAREITEFLLSCAASVDEANVDGDTPLHLAAWMGHRDCVESLLQRGASLVSANRYGLNVLDNIKERFPLLVRNAHRVLAGKRPKPLPVDMEETIKLLETAWAQRDDRGRSNRVTTPQPRIQTDGVNDHA